MKNIITRILIRAILFSLISGIVVLITGLLLGWKTYTQFSDGFFWAGSIMIAIGFVNIMGRLNDPILPYRQPTLDLGREERFNLWAADTLHHYNTLALLGTSGFLLFGMAGLAILIGKLF